MVLSRIGVDVMSEQYFTRPNVQPVITNIGTTPEQRQMSTSEFKAKFDEMPEAIQQYIKETLLIELDAFKGDFLEHIDKYLALKTNFETHQAEKVTHGFSFSRDLQIAGNQTISGLPFVPETLLINGVVHGTAKTLVGVYTRDFEFCISGHPTASVFYRRDSAIVFHDTTNDRTNGRITLNSNKSITIQWEKLGAGASGTADVYVVAIGHKREG